jgi:hypothetical protein
MRLAFRSMGPSLEYLPIVKTERLRPERFNRPAGHSPNETAYRSDARQVEQVAGRPPALRRRATPCVEKTAAVVQRLTPSRFRHVRRTPTIQPRPWVEIDGRNRIGRHASALMECRIVLAGALGYGWGYGRKNIICRIDVYNQ